MNQFFFTRRYSLLCLLLTTIVSSAWAQVPLTTINSPYTQDFNTLANTGTSATLPTGFAFLESGSNANTTYTAGIGSSNAGDTYSFGAAGNTERALGGLRSGNLIPTFGASFVNNTGATVTSLAISYTGEQWRLGTAGRVDRLDFQYSLDATSLTTGTYTDVDALDFTAPVTTAPLGLLDGNAAANRTAVSGTITGLSIAPGATFWIRYNDFAATGANDGLGIDDFSLTPVGTPPCANLNVPADYPTIQAAVNAACPGVTITVAAGTYTEQILINKNITIAGAGVSNTIIKAPATLAVGGPDEGAPYVKRNIVEIKGNSVVTMTGLTVNGTVTGQDGCGTDAFGIYVYDNSSVNVSSSAITNVRLTDPALFGCQVGFAIGIGLTGSPGSATLTNVTMNGYQKGGILARGAGSSLVAQMITVTGIGPTTVTGQNGVQISSGASATITSSTIANNNYTPPANDNTTASGLIAFNSGTVLLDGNTFTGNDVGIDVGGTGTVTASNNTFSNNEYASTFTDGVPTFTLTGNTFDKKATNTNQTGTNYSTIQAAVDDATAGDVITVASGTYNEQVLVNKAVTIRGTGATKPIINFTGTPALASGRPTLFEVTAPNVTIDNLNFTPDLTKVGSAVLASVAQPGSVSALTVTNNTIAPYLSGAYGPAFGLRNAISVNYGAYRVNSSAPGSLSISGNTITYNDGGTPSTPGSANSGDDAGFRSGIATDEGGGTFTSNTIQTVSQDIQVRFGLAGAINVTNNTINGGGVELAEQNSGAGPITVTGNTFNGAAASAYTSSLRLKNNTANIPTTVSNNTFTGHNQAVSLENYRAVAVTSNTFTPATGSTTYRHVTVDTKEFSSSSGAAAPAISLTLLSNTFTGSSSPTSGTALVFANQDNDSPVFGPFVIGTVGQENNFAASLGTFIALDGSTGTVNPNATQAAPFAVNINIANNKFDVGSGLQFPKDMTAAGRVALEDKLLHKPDNAALGRLSFFFPVQNVTQTMFYETIQLAVDAATAGDVLLAPAGTYPESVTINKAITLNGANAGVNPNTGARGAETILVPATSGATDAVYETPAQVNVLTLTGAGSGAVVDGLTFNGNNTALTGQPNSVVVNGEDIDATAGISSVQADNVTVRNNIFKNFSFDGVDLKASGTPTFATVTNNLFDNIAYLSNVSGSGQAIVALDNGYASITNNVMTRVLTGVQTNNHYVASPSAPSIANNTISTYDVGIFHNLQYQSASDFNIVNNTFNADGSQPTITGFPPFAGLLVYSILNTVPSTISSNTVNAGFDYGADVWNTPSPNVSLASGNMQGTTAGVRVRNVSGFGDGTAALKISGVTITNSPVGVLAFDNPAAATGITTSVTVTGNTKITGTGTFTAVAISGADASASIQGNAASFVGNGTGVGVDINGGSATVGASSISNFGVGINVSNGGKLGTTVNNFLTNNQTTGIRFAADAATTGQGPINDNSITTTATGTGRAIQNASGAGIAATCNWLGSVTALSPAYVQNTGAGSLTYTPTRTGGTDDATGPSNGFQPQDACVCPMPTVVASATGVCAGNSVTLTASGAASYTWSTGETTASITVTPTSNTTISLTATNEGGCVSTTAVTITVNDPPTNASLTSGTLTCAMTSATLTASATGGTSYTLLGGATSQSNTTGQFVVSTAGNYTAIIANASGCTATATATVTSNTVAPTATLTASNNPVCAPASVTLTAGGTGTSYTFSAGATQIGTSNQAIVTQSGTYSVTVSNASGCTATASTSVTVNQPPAAPTLTNVSRTVNASTTPLPLGQFVQATGSNTLSFSGVNGQITNPPTANISQPGAQSFSVTQTSASGCVSPPTLFTITVVATPGNQTVCRSSTVVLNAVTAGVRYEWYRNGQTVANKLAESAASQRGTATSSLTLVSIQTSATYSVKVFQADGSFAFDGPFAVTVNYGCTAPGGRVAAGDLAEAEVLLSVVLTPNPVVDGQLKAVVRGAGGQALLVELVDLRGQVVRSQNWPAADAEQAVEWNIATQPTGLYLMKAQVGSQTTTIKVIKQ